LPENIRFVDFIKKMEGRGAKAILYGKYLDMNTNTRIKYKMIKDALQGTGVARIEINKGETEYINEDVPFDRELCKQIFRTIKDVRMKHPSKILREDRIDKIIDYCVEQKKKMEAQNG